VLGRSRRRVTRLRFEPVGKAGKEGDG